MNSSTAQINYDMNESSARNARAKINWDAVKKYLWLKPNTHPRDIQFNFDLKKHRK